MREKQSKTYTRNFLRNSNLTNLKESKRRVRNSKQRDPVVVKGDMNLDMQFMFSMDPSSKVRTAKVIS